MLQVGELFVKSRRFAARHVDVAAYTLDDPFLVLEIRKAHANSFERLDAPDKQPSPLRRRGILRHDRQIAAQGHVQMVLQLACGEFLAGRGFAGKHDDGVAEPRARRNTRH